MSTINHPHQPGLTTEALQADVNAAKERFGQCEYAFTYVTVQALLDKIKELEDKPQSKSLLDHIIAEHLDY